MRKTIMGALVAASFLTLGVAQAQGFDPHGDIDRDGIHNRADNDRDGDGIQNRSDPQPNIYNRTRVAPHARDMDGDGIADASDRDRDGDGIPNARDPRPNIPDRMARGQRHGDQYGMRDQHGARVTPRDRDGDGVPNRRDRFPDNWRRA